MRNIDVVIGLNYGDEGKGLVTGFLAGNRSNETTAVVRFNGGPQAGHTVQLADGTRHVFHHFGAGTFAGAPTLLSKFFVVNPVLFFIEAEELAMKINESPHVFVDPEAYVTTPYDVFINQESENLRGDKRHGSCGVGFGETIERVERGFPLRVKDLQSDNAAAKLAVIKEQYFYRRLEELNLLNSDLTVLKEADTRFLQDCVDFIRWVNVYPDEKTLPIFDNLIFEGAQGLCLDQYSEDFPHVTRSSTGLENVAELIKNMDANINVHYLTRSYLTRHGVGPLKNEFKNLAHIKDETNTPNDYQGALRFAPLDFDRIRTNVAKDTQFLDGRDFTKTAVVTWCDQSEPIHDLDVEGIIEHVTDAVGADRILTSWGPTAMTIKRLLRARNNCHKSS